MKSPGIHTRFLLAAFVLIGASTAIFGIVGVRITSRFMHERFEDRIAFLARYLALNSEVGVLINDKEGLKNLAHNLLGEKDVARVLILDNHNNTLVDLSRSAEGPLSLVETPVVFKRASDENIVFSGGKVVARTPFEPVRTAIVDHIGKVRIHFSTHGIDLLMADIARRFIWMSLGLALIAGLVFYFVSRPIGSELKQLTATAMHIGRGDFELRARPGKLPETRALAKSFNAMLDSLKESQEDLARVNREMMKQKSLAEMGKFSLMIAHEVKNPLAIIKTSLDMIKRDYNLSSEQTLVGYIEDEIRRLNSMIEAFLQFARPTKPVFRTVDLNQMLDDVFRRFEMLHHQSALQLNLDLPERPAIRHADRDLMVRAFGNIIENACQAAGENGYVRIKAEVDFDRWRVQIEDNGGGIRPDDKGKIFEPFFTTRAKGTGLGLAFASQVFKSHGGFILVEDADSGGALFTVDIPLQQGR
ncbi:MAG: ATP-binding protein [Thermodesulfobacteriota bacterium]